MEAYNRLTIPQLRQLAVERGLRLQGIRRKDDIIQALLDDDYRLFVEANIGPPFVTLQVPVRPITPPRQVTAPYPVPGPITPIMEPNLVPIRTRVPPRFDRGAVPIPRMRNYEDVIEDLPVQPVPVRTPLEIIREKLGRAKFQPFDTRAYDRAGARTKINWGQPITTYKIFRQSIIDVIKDDVFSMNSVAYMMMLGNTDHVAALLTSFGFTDLVLNADACYNLLWYLHVIKYPTAAQEMLLTKSEISYISGFTEAQLLELLGTRYNGPRDKASLIFAAVTGYNVHNPGPEALTRYTEVSRYPSINAWFIAQSYYKIVDHEHGIISPYGPYVHIALQPVSTVERIMAHVTMNNVRDLIIRYGMTYKLNELTEKNFDVFYYFMDMIVDYEPVLTRAHAAPVPILNLEQLGIAWITQQLAIYTIDEIADVYEPQGTWFNRNGFIEELKQSYSAEPRWSWRNRHCNNNRMFNVLEGELRANINKNDLNNPTVSYGVVGNYACYQVAELEASFREDVNGVFQFFNPDWSPVNNVVEKVFPTASMRQLRDLLDNRTNDSPAISALHDKIVQGLAALAATTELVRKLRDEYNRMDPFGHQMIVKTYFVWLFLYGMWLRFWKGPGQPWPLKWGEGIGTDRCTAGTRDSNVVIQQGVHYSILQHADSYPGLTTWLNALPLVDYNFSTGEARLATEGATTIKEILDTVAQGRFCLANASDLVLRTAYFLITGILDIRTEEAFNKLLQDYIDILLDLERHVIEQRLLPANRKNERDQDLQVMLIRQSDIRMGTPVLPVLTMKGLQMTRHVDPDLGELIRFGE